MDFASLQNRGIWPRNWQIIYWQSFDKSSYFWATSGGPKLIFSQAGMFARVLFQKRNLTEFCAKLAEFCEKLGMSALAHTGITKAERKSFSSLRRARWSPKPKTHWAWCSKPYHSPTPYSPCLRKLTPCSPVNLLGGEKKPRNTKHINIFLKGLAGQSSRGQTGTRPRDKRDKMSILLWNSTENGRFVPAMGPNMSQGWVAFVPGTVRYPVRPEHRPAQTIIFLFVFLPDSSREY